MMKKTYFVWLFYLDIKLMHLCNSSGVGPKGSMISSLRGGLTVELISVGWTLMGWGINSFYVAINQ